MTFLTNLSICATSTHLTFKKNKMENVNYSFKKANDKGYYMHGILVKDNIEVVSKSVYIIEPYSDDTKKYQLLISNLIETKWKEIKRKRSAEDIGPTQEHR